VNVESHGQSRPQEGRQHTQNQDADVIRQGPVPWVAICDGAGNAQSAARRALSLLESWLGDTTLGELLREQTWMRWAKSLDSALTGGPESTLVVAAMIGQEAVVTWVGDSRAYLVPLEGPMRLLTAQASKRRLGSGDAQARVLREALRPRDTLVLLSDGAWGPLGSTGLERVVRSTLTKPFTDLPGAILDAASPGGRGDDMTAVTMRIPHHVRGNP
jgi:serine/threonine protein phosphatase PrpC